MYSLILSLLLIPGQCDCSDCKCTDCHCDWQQIYTQSIKENKIVVIESGDVQRLTDTPWRIIRSKSLKHDGYIVGVPYNGKLMRLDFPKNTTRERIRLNILHIYYPLGNGYVECPTCPQGRIRVQAQRSS